MTTSLTLRSSLATLAAAVLLMGMWASVAQAQSEVTGTLTAGTAATNTISGTVVSGAPECSDGIDNDNDGDIDMQDPACDLPTEDDESDDPGGASNNNRNSNNNNDDDDNDDNGEVLGTDTSTGVGGTGDVFTPGVPNTGAGGASAMTLATLVGSLAAMVAGAVALRRYRLS